MPRAEGGVTVPSRALRIVGTFGPGDTVLTAEEQRIAVSSRMDATSQTD